MYHWEPGRFHLPIRQRQCLSSGLDDPIPYYITKDQVKQSLTHVNIVTLNDRVNLTTSFTKEQLARAYEVRRHHYALLHPSAWYYSPYQLDPLP